jgi:LacI family transcriptional regulator
MDFPHFSPPSLKDVAREAGVSRATAQRALSNSPRCLPETKAKVQAAAASLGYKPQPVFAAMGARSRRTLMGDLPLAYIEATESRHRAGGAYFEAASERAYALGYKLHRIDLDTWTPIQRIWDILHTRGFGGVLVGGVRADNHSILLENKRFPIVCCGRVDPLPFHTVRPAILSAVKRAFEEITDKGYRRIGAAVLRHDPPVEDDFSRLATALGCLHGLGPEYGKIPPLACDIAAGAELVNWLREFRPDAVLGFHDGLLSEIRDAGFRVPEDIAFASLHRGTAEPVAGLDQNYRAIAFAAVNLIDQLIRHGEVGIPGDPLTITVEASWFEGPTLPQKPVMKLEESNLRG